MAMKSVQFQLRNGQFGFKNFEKFSKSGFFFWVDRMLIGEFDEHVESSDAYRILE